MRWIVFIILFLSAQLYASNEKVYLLVWGSTQTYTGAGHMAVAFYDSNEIHYLSHYPRSVGSIDTVIHNFEHLLSIDSLLGIQAYNAQLIIEFSVSSEAFKKMKKAAKRNVKKSWSLFNLNCTDLVKKSFRASAFDSGYAFLISTPYELINDLRDHNIEAFHTGKVKTIKGGIHPYLMKQPRAVPYVLKRFFFREK